MLWLASIIIGLELIINRAHNGDVFLQLATGRFISEHGFAWSDPFTTIAQGREWYNQQWLSELVMYYVYKGTGLTGITIFYALLLFSGLAVLLLCLRRKSSFDLFLCALSYVPGVFCVLHPRGAGFTLVFSSILVVLLLKLVPPPLNMGRTSGALMYLPGNRWILFAIPLLFVLWANMHAGFIGGLFLIGLMVAGLGVDYIRRRTPVRDLNTILVLAGLGLAGFAGTFATPLGASMWSYVTSFGNPGISVATKEWGWIFQSPQATFALAAAVVVYTAWWLYGPKPRSAVPLFVYVGFLIMIGLSLRNIVFLGPVGAFVVAWCRPNSNREPSRGLAFTAAVWSLGAFFVWLAFLGPAKTPQYLRSDLMGYVLQNPPPTGRVASVGGVGSYLLWRDPKYPVVLNGWLEHFTAFELESTYGIVNGTSSGLRHLRRLDVGGVVTSNPAAIGPLEASGFKVKLAAPGGTYLVRQD